MQDAANDDFGKQDEAAALPEELKLEDLPDPEVNFESWMVEEAVQNVMAELYAGLKDCFIPMKDVDVLCNRLYYEIYNRLMEMDAITAVDTKAIIEQCRGHDRSNFDDIKLITRKFRKIELQGAPADGSARTETKIGIPIPGPDDIEIEQPDKPLSTNTDIEEGEHKNEDTTM